MTVDQTLLAEDEAPAKASKFKVRKTEAQTNPLDLPSSSRTSSLLHSLVRVHHALEWLTVLFAILGLL